MWVELAMVSWAGGFHPAQLQEFSKIIQGLPPSAWQRAKIRGPHSARLDNGEIVQLPRKFPPAVTATINGLSTLIWQRKHSFRTAILREIPEQQLILTCTMQASGNLLDMAFNTLAGAALPAPRPLRSTLPVSEKHVWRRAQECAVKAGLLTSINQPLQVLIGTYQLEASGQAVLWSDEIRRLPPRKRLRAKTDTSTANLRRALARVRPKGKKKQRVAVCPATIPSLQEQVPPQSCTHEMPCRRHVSTVFLSVACRHVVQHQQPSHL